MRLNNFSLNFKQAYIEKPDKKYSQSAQVPGHNSFANPYFQHSSDKDSFVLSSASDSEPTIKGSNVIGQDYDAETPEEPCDCAGGNPPYIPSTVSDSYQSNQFYDPESGINPVEFDEELW